MSTHVPVSDHELAALVRHVEAAKERLLDAEPPTWEIVGRLIAEIDDRGRLYIRTIEMHREAIDIVRRQARQTQFTLDLARDLLGALTALARGSTTQFNDYQSSVMADLAALEAAVRSDLTAAANLDPAAPLPSGRTRHTGAPDGRPGDGGTEDAEPAARETDQEASADQ